jgi:hypothetical protein
MTRRAWLVVLAAVSSCSPVLGVCPDLYLLRGDASVDGPLDIVFFPAGFGTDELPAFRCAVDRLLEGLDEEPFVEDTCRFNVFRGDLEAASPGFVGDSSCAACPATHWSGTCEGDQLDAYLTPTGTKTSGSVEEDRNRAAPDVRCCWNGSGTGDDLSISADAQSDFVAMASCARQKPADLVVVVVNASGNLAALYSTEPPIVLVSLDGIFGDAAGDRFAHEIGHALRLLDETDLPYGPFDETLLPTFLCDRNVALIEMQGGEDPAISSCAGEVPWAEACTSPPPNSTPGPCVPTIDACVQSRNTSGGCADCAAPAADIGLVEGAFYHACGYYRSSSACRMWNYGKPFCEVCGEIARTELAGFDPVPSCTDSGDRVLSSRREISFERERGRRWTARPVFPPPIPAPPWPPEPGPPPPPFHLALDGLPVAEFEAEMELEGVVVSVAISRLDIEWEGARNRISTLAVEPGFPHPRLRTHGPVPFDRRSESIRSGEALALQGVRRLVATEARTRRRFEPLRVTLRAPDRQVPIESRP